MILKLILKLSDKLDLRYVDFGHNISSDCKTLFYLVSYLINNGTFTEMLTRKDEDGKYPVLSDNNIEIHYDLLDLPDYYLSFYDNTFDDYWMKICEKKYESKDFIFDEETPVLHFSKLNIDAFLKSWEKLKDFDFMYLIITQDDKGWIDIKGKQELSQEELEIVKNTRKPTF